MRETNERDKWERQKNRLVGRCGQCAWWWEKVALPGLEPGMTESKSGVLPLHHRALVKRVVVGALALSLKGGSLGSC
jgi:hypothetical protein